MSDKHKTLCPECDESIKFSRRPSIGFIVKCSRCYETFEVISLRPIELDWPLDDSHEEDYDKAFDFDFDSEDDLEQYSD